MVRYGTFNRAYTDHPADPDNHTIVFPIPAIFLHLTGAPPNPRLLIPHRSPHPAGHPCRGSVAASLTHGEGGPARPFSSFRLVSLK